MNILITGGTGFLGSALVDKLIEEGHTLTVVSRSTPKIQKIRGDKVIPCERDYQNESFPAEAMEGIETVIHLMGESLAAPRWMKKKRDRIWNSRINSTKKIGKALPESCTTFICGSAIGIYPSQPGAEFTEEYSSDHPQTFLQKVCYYWELAASKARTTTRRVVNLRTGVVLDPDGGALVPLQKVCRYIGGIVPGNPTRPLAWISRDDRIGSVIYLLHDETISGPVNLVAPSDETWQGLFTYLCQKFSKPYLGHIPSWMIRFGMGRAAEFVLAWQKVLPQKLLASGYSFLKMSLHDTIKA